MRLTFGQAWATNYQSLLIPTGYFLQNCVIIAPTNSESIFSARPRMLDTWRQYGQQIKDAMWRSRIRNIHRGRQCEIIWKSNHPNRFSGFVVWIGNANQLHRVNYRTSFNGTHLGNGMHYQIRYRAGWKYWQPCTVAVRLLSIPTPRHELLCGYFIRQNIASAVLRRQSKTTNGFTISLSAGITGILPWTTMAIPYHDATSRQKWLNRVS